MEDMVGIVTADTATVVTVTAGIVTEDTEADGASALRSSGPGCQK